MDGGRPLMSPKGCCLFALQQRCQVTCTPPSLVEVLILAHLLSASGPKTSLGLKIYVYFSQTYVNVFFFFSSNTFTQHFLWAPLFLNYSHVSHFSLSFSKVCNIRYIVIFISA
ncbi:hypothetical protein HanIR_Chr17g0900201 [Helianthus annuus]|nr:hypothetical protein HanIR_Chr17g0900201 [Helianthus annuus]KAJ0449430.1 hypothetical protein HanHA89_Chr17g0728361 [Helianthus annuus]